MNRYKQVLSTLIITPVKQAANTTAVPLKINYLEIYENDNKTKFRIAFKDKLLTERESFRIVTMKKKFENFTNVMFVFS